MATHLDRLFEVYPANSRVTVPVGIRVNDMVYGSGLAGADPDRGKPADDVRDQMRAALDRLQALVEGAGGTLDNVARVAAFVTREEDRDPTYEPWDALFPDPADRPAFKVLLAALPEEHLVHLDAIAIAGQRRTRIDIRNVPARDPSVKIGNWLFTSRCHGNDQETGEVVTGGLETQTWQTLENLATLAGLAGGSEESIVQVTMFGRDATYMAAARRVFEERFPDPAARPPLRQLVNYVVPRFEISIEMVAKI